MSGTPASDREDQGRTFHPGGAGWYGVVAIYFRVDSEIVGQLGVNVGIICKEQLYAAAARAPIEAWASAAIQLMLNGPEWAEPERNGVWATAEEEAAFQVETDEVEWEGVMEALGELTLTGDGEGDAAGDSNNNGGDAAEPAGEEGSSWWW